MNEVKCVFETKLSIGDVAKLNKIPGAVIPVAQYAPLICPADVGLHKHVSYRTDYSKLHLALNSMFPTVFRKLEGNQMVLAPMRHGQIYTILNTGPFSWEKGDRLTWLPPMFSLEHTTVLHTPSWDLMLPIIVPVQVAREINIRNILLTLLSINRQAGRETETSQEIRRIRFREVTIDIPATLDTKQLNNVRNLCTALALVTNVTPGLLTDYVQRLSTVETDMIVVKSYELLSKIDTGNLGGGPGNPNEDPINVSKELQKITGLLNLINYISSVINDNPMFIVTDITPDNKMATCTFML
ncbi:triplex capsid protein 2 [Elephant endotheliotropic herpesvirus 3A]|uniref:Triplex capsid protein 2 n=1 Tax=Elephant endotheliotropic herpesvirus 3A TaxID=1329409 RepID=A0A866VSR1_9BETA|nr:triplex capsid protein 2 [Elephant endotheliotropic herpesvirus 3A]QOE74447.1 triplex capsid protein 2 [Elephant endotheliotropic herpesvirus 3A]